MKKTYAVVISAALAAAMLVGCGADTTDSSAPVEPTQAPAASAEEQTAVYTLYNTTGETITNLYFYEAGSEDIGENYAGEGMAADAVVEVTRTAASEEEADGKTYVLEFTTESGATQKYETVHFEMADISLLSVDAAAGATPISFTAPEQKAEYQITNTTGEAVTELYLYENGTEDKGENLAGEGMAADAKITLNRTASAADAENISYVLEFTTESGATQKYETVGFEVVAINLLSVDAAAGATPIEFAPVAE